MVQIKRPPKRLGGKPVRSGVVSVPIPDGYVSTAELGRRLGVSHSTVTWRMYRGEIPSEEVTVTVRLIPESALQDLLDQQEREVDE